MRTHTNTQTHKHTHTNTHTHTRNRLSSRSYPLDHALERVPEWERLAEARAAAEQTQTLPPRGALKCVIQWIRPGGEAIPRVCVCVLWLRLWLWPPMGGVVCWERTGRRRSRPPCRLGRVCGCCASSCAAAPRRYGRPRSPRPPPRPRARRGAASCPCASSSPSAAPA
eukprot:1196071-Prorocentrum_minimum.AAC.5